MKNKDLIKKLLALDPEAEVWQIYDGMAQDIDCRPADEYELREINEVREKRFNDLPLEAAIVFWAG